MNSLCSKPQFVNSPVSQFVEQLDELMLGCLSAAGELVLEACDYHFAQGGSRQRAKLCYQTARSFGFAHLDSMHMAACVELIHNASLVHDDIQDKDMVRRNAQSVWVKYSRDVAICIGDAMIIAAFQSLSSVNLNTKNNNQKSKVLRLISERTLETVHGQVKDITNDTKIDASQYYKIAQQKSAPLIMLSVQIPAVLSGRNEFIEPLSNSASMFALAYQFFDDLIDAKLDDNSNEPNIVNITMNKSKDKSWHSARAEVKNEILHLLEQATKTLAICPTKHTNSLIRLVDNLRGVVMDVGL
jgi:geranylgeranyl pyrophosphate synthase